MRKLFGVVLIILVLVLYSKTTHAGTIVEDAESRYSQFHMCLYGQMDRLSNDYDLNTS